MVDSGHVSTGLGNDSTGPSQELANQLRWHWEHHLAQRLQGMTDEEYHWEPALGAWGLRPRGASGPEYSGAIQAGGGEWLVDFAVPEPSPPPLTTIAWRTGHVLVGVLGARMADHFGGPAMDYSTYDYPGTAEAAYASLGAAIGSWCDAVGTLGPAELDQPVGEAEGPWAEHPMLELVLHINREAIHHGAEMCLLRDLYRADRT